MRPKSWLSLGLLLAAAVACGGEDESAEEGEEELPVIDCATVAAVPTFSQVTAFTKCVTCHHSMKTGVDRQAAPPDDNFDTYEAAFPKAEEAAHEVFEGEMPPATSMLTLTEPEKQQLYEWAICGAPGP